MFPFIGMFLVTSIAMLRERTTGTLERLMTLRAGQARPAARLRARLRDPRRRAGRRGLRVGFLALGLEAPHGAWLVGLLAIGNALLGMALGLLLSAFARTEFQAVQFMPAFVFPQLLLCGLFVAATRWPLPRDRLVGAAVHYAYDALDRVHARRAPAPLGGGIPARRLVVVGAGDRGRAGPRALTLRRRTP